MSTKSGSESTISIDFTFNKEPATDTHDFDEESARVVLQVPARLRGKHGSRFGTGYERARSFELRKKEPIDYKRLDLMYRLYRICENLNFPNNERIYQLYLKRLVKRTRLEYSERKLCIIAAALYYIDQSGRSVVLRDVLSKIPNANVHIKRFAKYTAQVCHELGISVLPSASQDNLIAHCLHQIRVFCSDACIGHIPKSTTLVVSKLSTSCDLDEFITQGDSLDASRGQYIQEEDDTPLDGATATSDAQESPSAFANPSRFFHHRKIAYRNIKSRYESIETRCKALYRLLSSEGSVRNDADLLDADARRRLTCDKTLVGAMIHIVFQAMGIKVPSGIVIEALNLSKSSFYRHRNKIYADLATTFTRVTNLATLSFPTLNLLITYYLECMLNSKVPALDAAVHCDSVKNDKGETRDTTLLDSRQISKLHKTLKLRNVNIAGYLSSVKRLCGPCGDASSASIINEQSRNRLVVRWRNTCGKIEKRCFSKSKYGEEAAIAMANTFIQGLC